jgi:VanZ family protein
LLGLLLCFDRALSVGKGVSTLLLLALTSEILQFFVPLRTPRVSDLVVDALGIALGMGLARLAMRAKRLRE